MTFLLRYPISLGFFLFVGLAAVQAAPLHEAAQKGDKARVEALIAEGADINTKDENDYLPLHSAVESAKQEIVELLLAHGAAVDGRGVHSRGMTPLHFAAYRGLKVIAELLLTKDADLNARDLNGQTPLFLAVNSGRKDVVEMLVAKGADVFAQANDGTTILHESAGRGTEYYQTIVEVLLAGGANVDGRDRSGRTALHLATFYGSGKVAEFLLAKGAEVDAIDSHGATPLFNATTNDGVADVFRLLLAKDANVNVQNKDGLTPLHNAAEGGTKEILELLLDKDPDLLTKNADGRTPLDYAALGGRKDNFVLLLAKVAARPLSADAESAIHQGIEAAKQSDYPLAIRFFETVRKEAGPYSPLPLYYLGLAESKITGRELRAICWLRAFLAASPDSPLAEKISDEIANLETRNREVLLAVIKGATAAVDLLPEPPANEPQDPNGSALDFAMKSVALLWARAGDADEALQRARRISHPFLRTLTAIEIARPLALAGDLERGKRAIATAVSAAEKLERSDDQANALGRAAAALADLGDAAGAHVIAARIDDAGVRCQAELAIARSQAISGNFAAATTTAEAIPVRFYRSAAQAFIARTAAESGDLTSATHMVELARTSLEGVVYNQNSVYDFGVRAAVAKAGRGYNLDALKRGVLLQEYDPREPPAPTQSVSEVDRQSFDVRYLYIDCFVAENLLRDLDVNATRSYLLAGHAPALKDLCVARARLGKLEEAKAIVELRRNSDYRDKIDERSLAEMRVGIARGHVLAGDLASGRMQLAEARLLARPEELRLIAEASNGWIAANEYLLNDTVFTALREQLKGLPNTFPQQTFWALADTALTMADAQAIVFAPRSRPLNP